MSDPARRIAVTGAAGYVGRSLIERLETNDAVERVVAIDIRPAASQPAARQHTARVVFRQQSVTPRLADLFAEQGIDSVVHLAFSLSPGHDREAIRRANVGGVTSVLEACASASVTYFLYLSSTTVYGAHPDNPLTLTEDSPVRPVPGFQYGEDKAATEAVIADFTDQHPGVKVAVLRVCPVLGPNADNFVSSALSKKLLVGVSGYDPPMQIVHEEDVAEVMVQCLSHKASGVYNVAGDGAIPWSEMAAIAGRRLVKLPAPLIYGLTSATWSLRLQRDSPAAGLDFVRYRWTVSTDKIKGKLGFKSSYSSRETWEAFVKGRA